jgi:hypothetical protein
MVTLLMTKPNQSDEVHEIIHWTWADDENEALCGADVSSHKWFPDTVPVNCADCIRIDEICTLDDAYYSEE